jgi:gp16 family phage-associated protein
MENEQRIHIIEEKLTPLGMSIKEWAKNNELDHRIVNDLITGTLRGTHGVSLNARKKMEDFFGPIFET